MKSFTFKFYIRTSKGQEFIIGQKTINAKDYDTAARILNYSPDTPFHHFSTVESK